MTTLRTLTCVGALVLSLSACSDPPTTSVAQGPRATWDAAGIGSYTFTVMRGCFCPQEYIGPFTVTVVDGAPVAVVRGRKEIPVDDETLGELPLTVEQLFTYIDEVGAQADDVSVSYDADLGFPSRISVDLYANAVDDEMQIAVSDFRAET